MDNHVDRREFMQYGLGALTLTDQQPAIAIGQSKPCRKRALIVAVWDYFRPRQKDTAEELNSQADAACLKSVLLHVLKFDDVKILSSKAETTRKAILNAISQFLDATKDGDVLMLHYSGHGSYVADPMDPLGIDQTLVPSDYVSEQDRSNDIRDKELARLLKVGLQGKSPAAFMLTFDSCHSGTITRGNQAKKRGFDCGSLAFAYSRLERRSTLLTSEAIGRQGFTAISACRSSEVNHETTDERGKPIGSLAYALCRALATADDRTTYRDLFEQCTSIIRAKGLRQTPQMEGPLDQIALGDGTIQHQSYIPVIREGSDAVLTAGTLMGLLPGSKVALYARGTRVYAGGNELAEATLTNPGATRTILTVPGRSAADLDGARALVTEWVYNDDPLNVDISLLRDHPRRIEIHASLARLVNRGLVRLGESGSTWDIQIAPALKAFTRSALKTRLQGKDGYWSIEALPAHGRNEAGGRSVTLRGADPGLPETLVLLRGDSSLLGAPFAQQGPSGKRTVSLTALGNGPDLADHIQRALIRETRNRLFSQLPGKAANTGIRVELRIIVCDGEADRSHPGAYRWKKDVCELQPGKGSQFSIRAGTLFRVEVCNTGAIPAYVVLVDLDSEGGIGPLWPNPRLARMDESASLVMPRNTSKAKNWMRLMASGKEKDYALWRFTEPAGAETVTAIATPKYADFSPLFDLPALDRAYGRAVDAGFAEANSPLGRLFASITTRREQAGPVPADWSAFAMHINVLPESSV